MNNDVIKNNADVIILITWLMLIFFFVTFFILFRIIYNRKTYFINNNSQTNKTFYHPLYPSLWLLKTISFYLLPRLNLTPLTPRFKSWGWIKAGKVPKSFGLQNIFNLLPFSLVHLCFFIVYWNFSSMFLTFMISLIKDFIINDADLLEL